MKLSELKEIVRRKGFGTKLYGNVNGEPVYLSCGVRELFLGGDQDMQTIIETVGRFQGGDYGSAAERGKTSAAGHEYGRYEIASVETDTEDDDPAVWIHRAEAALLVYFRFER